MAADYRGDVRGLLVLRSKLTALRADASLGYLADYWSGYAAWRAAMNGASRSLAPSEMEAHLARAAADFQQSLARNARFADAYAAASSVHGWLLTFHADDPAWRREHSQRSTALMNRGKELEPDNPRVLWVDGGSLLFRPAAYGGDFEAGMQTYRKIVAARPALSPDSPLPDWGYVEALMSLAYGYLHQAVPDTDAALREANAALRLQPGWYYVRRVLLPQIEAQLVP
jgi:hypothetical protein